MEKEFKIALIAAAAAIIAAFIPVVASAVHIGAKANQGESTNIFKNVGEGTAILYRMAVSDKALSASLPTKDQPKPVIIPCPTPTETPKTATAPPISAPQPVVPIEEAISTDPKVLSACFGAAPLTVERVIVEGVPNGYDLTFRFKNGTKSAISIWVDGARQLTDSNGNRLPATATNLPGTDYYTFINTEQKALQATFVRGTTIQPDDSGAMTFTFAQRGELNPGNAVTLSANLAYDIKDEADHYTFRRTTFTCQNLPVMTSKK